MCCDEVVDKAPEEEALAPLWACQLGPPDNGWAAVMVLRVTRGHRSLYGPQNKSLYLHDGSNYAAMGPGVFCLNLDLTSSISPSV